MFKLKCEVNGTGVELECAADTALLLVLRNDLGLNSPRYGCGVEQCGACMVQVNGEPRYACTLRADEVQNADVTTLEGLAAGDLLHPLQEAFLELNAGQCGYCLSGILMSASRLLRENPVPNRSDVQQALAAHLCRCGAHNRIINAVLLAAERLA